MNTANGTIRGTGIEGVGEAVVAQALIARVSGVALPG
jgi:hypothetical protein